MKKPILQRVRDPYKPGICIGCYYYPGPCPVNCVDYSASPSDGYKRYKHYYLDEGINKKINIL